MYLNPQVSIVLSPHQGIFSLQNRNQQQQQQQQQKQKKNIQTFQWPTQLFFLTLVPFEAEKGEDQ